MSSAKEKWQKNLNLNLPKKQTGGVKEKGPPLEPKSPNTLTLEELAECEICMEILSSPRMLPCQHTFCLQCLRLMSQYKPLSSSPSSQAQIKPSLPCPICQREVPLEEGLQTLENLPKNLYIESLLSLLSNGTNFGIEKICNTCSTSNITEQGVCQHCKQIFCQDCFKLHKAKLYDDLSSNLRDTDTQLLHRQENANAKFDRLKCTIKSVVDSKILDLKVQEEELLEQVDRLMEEETNLSLNLKDKIYSVSREIQTVNKEKSLDSYKILVHKSEKIIDEVSRWGETRITFDEEKFILDLADIHNNNDEGPADEGSPENCTSPLEKLDTMVSYYQHQKLSPKLVWNKCPRPAGVAIPPWSNHHLYIAANETKLVLILDRISNKVIGRLIHDEMLCPHSVTFCDKRQEIFVTDKWKHCIHVFSNHGDHKRTLCSRGTGDGKLLSPEGITTTAKGEIVVCDTGNSRVLIINAETGQQIVSMGRTKKKFDLRTPTSVSCWDSKIFIADSGNNRVKIFGLKGEKLFEFGCTGRGEGQFRFPEVLTVDPFGFILVGDAGNARIQVFNPKGKFVKIFNGNFKWISGLLVSSQMEIVVTDHKSKSVQIF